LDLLGELELLYIELNYLVIEYESIKQWKTTPFTSWDQQGIPTGIVIYQQQLYVCNYTPHLAVSFNLKDGKKIKENSTFLFPCGIDVDEEKERLYLADKKTISILNLKLDSISTLELPVIAPESSYFRGIKFNNNILYLSLQNIQQIFLLKSDDGKVLNQWGNEDGGSNIEEFREPRGLTVNSLYLYICDQ